MYMMNVTMTAIVRLLLNKNLVNTQDNGFFSNTFTQIHIRMNDIMEIQSVI